VQNQTRLLQDLLYSHFLALLVENHLLICLEAGMEARAYLPSSSNGNWKQLYMAALFEDDAAKIVQRITAAESALAARAVEVGEDGHEAREQQAMENAAYFLQLLRKIESKTNPPYESSRVAYPSCPQEEWA
jgi:hypothetical protein